MAEYKKEISRDDYLKALALFTMAHDHYTESVRFARALNRIIMVVPEQFPGGHTADAIYAEGTGDAIEFDEAIRRDGISVSGPEKVE